MTSGGVHDAALCCLLRFLNNKSRVLDLGAGRGAWAARLLELGHEVTCIDRDAGRFAIDSADCVTADLNDDFAARIKGVFGAITAIEVIETLRIRDICSVRAECCWPTMASC
jgi:predicted RNA methylase